MGGGARERGRVGILVLSLTSETQQAHCARILGECGTSPVKLAHLGAIYLLQLALHLEILWRHYFICLCKFSNLHKRKISNCQANVLNSQTVTWFGNVYNIHFIHFASVLVICNLWRLQIVNLSLGSALFCYKSQTTLLLVTKDLLHSQQLN